MERNMRCNLEDNLIHFVYFSNQNVLDRENCDKKYTMMKKTNQTE